MKIIRPGSKFLIEQGLTQSMLSTWACRQKFLFTINGYRKRGTKEKTFFGEIGHAGLEYHYKNKGRITISEYRQWIEKFASNTFGRGGIVESDALELALLQNICLYKEYRKHYKNDFKLKVLGVEKIFDRIIDSTRRRGKVDVLFCKGGQHLFLMDHKFRGRVMVKVMRRRLGIDNQHLYYTDTLSRMYKKYRSCTFIYNIIGRPQTKLHVKETLQQYKERLSTDIALRPNFYFIRFHVSTSKNDILFYRKQLKEKIHEIGLFLDNKLSMYRNEECCEMSHDGISYECEYLDACMSRKLIGYQKNNLFTELQ